MQWIIDLLIDKIKKDKTKEWEPEPLWIEEDLPVPTKVKEKGKEDRKKVIIIDL